MDQTSSNFVRKLGVEMTTIRDKLELAKALLMMIPAAVLFMVSLMIALAMLSSCINPVEQAKERCASYGLPNNPQCLIYVAETERLRAAQQRMVFCQDVGQGVAVCH